jgi:hypothetical protein
MAYYEDRRYAPRDRYSRPATYADPHDDPRGHYARHDREYSRRISDDSIEEVQRDYVYERGYTSRRPRGSRPVYENVRRASSVSGYDPHYDAAYSRSSRPRQSRHYEEKRVLAFVMIARIHMLTFLLRLSSLQV